MKCQQCGAEVVPGAAFCQACGAPLPKTAPKGPAVKKPLGAAAAVEPDEPEQVLWEGRFSKLAMLGGWVAAGAFTLAVLIFGWAASLTGPQWFWALAAIAVAWIGMLLRLVYRQFSIRYTLTNQRLIHERGLLWRQMDRIEPIDVDDVQFVQGPIERLVGVGTIHVISSDQSTPQFNLVGIEDVRRVATLIDDVRRKERRKRAVHIESV
jgi:membrane protein YdbS with pleckstrin-like domain